MKKHVLSILVLLAAVATGAVAQNYTITLPSVSNGSVAAKVNDTPVTSAAAGETVSLVATPDAGYGLKTISATSNISETFSSGANTRTGTYFSVSGSNYVYGWRIGSGDHYTLTISSLSNQNLSQVVLTVGGPATAKQRNISHLQADHGTLSATGTAQGSTITITGINSPTVTVSAPDSNNGASMWSITQAKVDDGLGNVALTLTDTSDDNVKTFTMPSGNVTVSAEFESAVAAGYSVALKDGTEDATSWQGKAGEGEYQALPLEGVAAGTAVSVKYNGTKKVKSVKAVKKVAGKVVDLSTYSGTSYEVIEDVTFTGTTNNEISILYKGEGYEVTLDNVNAPASFIAAWDDNYTVNVKLKGTSRLKGIYDQNADVNIGEAEAGGTVILVDESSPLGGSGTTITINGGTVKAKTSSFSALYNALEVNSGAVYLEAAEGYGAVDGSASGSVTLYGWNGSAWVTYSDHRYLSTDNGKAPSEWTW